MAKVERFEVSPSKQVRRFDLDRDVHRDAASAFGPASLLAGGLLPYEGRSFLMSHLRLPSAALDERQDGWLSPNNPILVRGPARILPLAWLGEVNGEHGAGVRHQEILALASKVQGAGMYWAGPWRVLSLTDDRADSIGSYIAALRAAGATQVDCWTYSKTVGIALVRAGAEDEGTMSLALHIVPVNWVSEPRAWESKPRVTAPVRGIDIRWSWADVIALGT